MSTKATGAQKMFTLAKLYTFSLYVTVWTLRVLELKRFVSKLPEARGTHL